MQSLNPIDKNGIEYKYTELEQYDYYDNDNMQSKWSHYDKRIGSLLIAFSELEQTLDKALAFIISEHSDDTGFVIIMDLKFRQKIELFNRLCKAYLTMCEDRKDIAKLKRFVGDFISAGEIRNIVAHARWMSLDENGFVRSKTGIDEDAYVRFKYYKLTPKVLYSVERRINKLNRYFYNFLEAHNLC